MQLDRARFADDVGVLGTLGAGFQSFMQAAWVQVRLLYHSEGGGGAFFSKSFSSEVVFRNRTSAKSCVEIARVDDFEIARAKQ